MFTNTGDNSDDEEATSKEEGEDFVVENLTADDKVKVIAQAVRKENKFLNKTKKHKPPPLQVKWSVPYNIFLDACSCCRNFFLVSL
jgi:hypothetical protein